MSTTSSWWIERGSRGGAIESVRPATGHLDMTVKYETITTSVGEMAAEFAAEGILVFFGPDAPEELHDFSIITEASELSSPVEPGDVVEIGDSAFPVMSVGSVANDNLAGLGHLVVKFNGLAEPELPGDVSLPAVPAPPIEVGTRIRITRES